ncbi:MAG TPA: HDOD domain-containing protein [Telluria sp.]|jgi:HD-like signal output (HDOD) protein
MMHPPDFDIRNRLLVAPLPAMPQILIKLIGHLQAEDLDLPALAALIGADPGMSARLLAVANSASHHRSMRGAAIEQALLMLGTDTIKQLVIGESVVRTLGSFPHAATIDLRRFWQQALSAALIARELAARMAYRNLEEAYLAGLLHNVGRLALLASAPREYAFNFNARDDEALCAAEQGSLQITHAEAGAWLIARWNLDSFLADAVLYHHEPSARLTASHSLVRIVRLAHLLACHDAQSDEAELCAALALCGQQAGDAIALREHGARQVHLMAADLGIELAGVADLVCPAASKAQPCDPVQQRLGAEGRHLVLVPEPAPARSGAVDCVPLIAAVQRQFHVSGSLPATLHLGALAREEALWIDGDPALLRQILEHLVGNAVAALAGCGRVDIASRGQVRREGRVYVALAVSDNGPGMAPEVMATLFSAARSPALGHHSPGLATVHALVRKMNGMISCRSGRAGTSFEILLPASGGASSVAGVRARLVD